MRGHPYAHLRGVAIDPTRWGHGWNVWSEGPGPYCVYTLYGFTLYTPAAPRAPARDCGKPRSSLERPDPENSRPHTCTEIEYGTAPLPKELYSLARLAHMHT